MRLARFGRAVKPKRAATIRPPWATRLCMALEGAGQMNQVKLAKSLGVSQRTVSHWMAGEREPPYKALVQLRDITGVSLDWIITGKGPPAE